MFEPAINNWHHSHLSPCLQAPQGLFQDPLALGAYDGMEWYGISWNHHRIMEWPALKRTPKIISFQSPAMCRVANQQTRLSRGELLVLIQFSC